MKKNKIKFIILTVSQLFILIILIGFNKIYFATNDDTTMVDLASGAYGKCSPYIINIHIIMGYIYNILFEAVPMINWITVSYIIIYIFSGMVLNYIFCHKGHFGIIFSTLTLSYLIVISYFSFTVVAYYAAISGFIAIIDFIETRDRKSLILGALAILFGILFRAEVLKSLCITYLALVLYKSLKKSYRRQYWGGLIVLIIAMYVGIYSNLYIETRNSVERQHLSWGEIRSEALDCAPVPYEEQRFNEAGISLEQYNAMYNAFYYDYANINSSVFMKLSELNNYANKYNFDVIQFFLNYIKKFRTFSGFSSLYMWCFLFVTLYFCIDCIRKNNKREILAVLIWGGVIFTELIFYVIKRNPYRVVMPGYLMGEYILLYFLAEGEKKVEYTFKVKSILTFCSLIIPILGLCIRLFKYDLLPEYIFNDCRISVLTYLIEHNDTVFITGDTRVYSLDVGRSIWDYTAKHGYWNIMGNWEIYGQAYYDLMDIYQIDNPDSLLLESVNNDQVKIITTYGDEFPLYFSYITSWLKKYYNIDAEFEKEEEISKVSINNGGDFEEWCVYRIVSIK